MAWIVVAATRTAGAAAGDMDLSGGHIAAASVSLGLLGLVVGTITLLIGSATGRRAATLAMASVLALGGYFANNLGSDAVRKLSPFYYANGDTPLVNGWNAAHLIVLTVLAALAVAVAVGAFNRRDLAV